MFDPAPRGLRLLAAQPAQASPVPRDTDGQFIVDLADADYNLRVVEAFTPGNRFDTVDFGIFIGRTSPPAHAGVDCGDDPLRCPAIPGMSRGVFAPGAGAPARTVLTSTVPFARQRRVP